MLHLSWWYFCRSDLNNWVQLSYHYSFESFPSYIFSSEFRPKAAKISCLTFTSHNFGKLSLKYLKACRSWFIVLTKFFIKHSFIYSTGEETFFGFTREFSNYCKITTDFPLMLSIFEWVEKGCHIKISLLHVNCMTNRYRSKTFLIVKQNSFQIKLGWV